MFTLGTLFLVYVVLAAYLAQADSNITYDDSDPAIIYEGTWEPDSEHLNVLDYGGAHTVSTDPLATASFEFNGTGIYFWSPLWPFPFTVDLTLDAEDPIRVDLQDHTYPVLSDDSPETAASMPVWGMNGLNSTTHLLTISPNGLFVVVDGLTVTIPDATSIETSSSSEVPLTTTDASLPISSDSPIITTSSTDMPQPTINFSTPTDSSSTPASRTNLSIGAIVGIVLGTTIGTGILLTLLYISCFRKASIPPALTTGPIPAPAHRAVDPLTMNEVYMTPQPSRLASFDPWY